MKIVSPPLSPKLTRIKNIPRKRKKPRINITAHLPRVVFGKIVSFIYSSSPVHHSKSGISPSIFLALQYPLARR